MVVLLLIAAVPGLALAQEEAPPSIEDVVLAVDTMWVIVAAVLVISCRPASRCWRSGSRA
jgi:hypothetical protein